MNWARKQKVPRSAAKFVLWVMADLAASDLSFVSVGYIADATGMDRKTVMANIDRLQRWGLIEDTGERRGKTKQIPVYRLRMEGDLFDNAPNGTKNGTGTKSGTDSGETVPIFPPNSTNFSGKRYQKRDTDPKDPKDPNISLSARAAESTAAPSPSQAGMACRALHEAGMPLSRLNPSHPVLLSTLKADVTIAELEDTARELIARGGAPPGLVYVCRTALGRRQDAAANPPPGETHAASPIHPRRSAQPVSRNPSAAQRIVASILARRADAAAS